MFHLHFFVWTKNEIKNDLRRKEPKENNDFLFLSRGDKNADFTINGNNGKIKELSQITNLKAEHYIKSLIDVDELKNRFRNIKFIFYSSVNGKNAWISQKDILEQYNELYGK